MLKEISLQGKTALITGGGTGLGLAIAKEMADAGAKIIITGRRKEKLDEALSELPSDSCGFVNDITELASIKELVHTIESTIGPIDILVNNAGIQIKKDFFDFTEEDFYKVYDTHAIGSLMMTRECAKYMKQRQKGVIIMITSLSTVFGMPLIQPYTMAKSAIAGLVRSLTAELTPFGIRVNSINPGFVETEMLRNANAKEPGRKERILARCPMKRMGTTQEIGMAATFLASDAGGFIAGVDLRVDGGISIAF